MLGPPGVPGHPLVLVALVMIIACTLVTVSIRQIATQIESRVFIAILL